MSSYADNAPIVVERAEGHELIDVDGRGTSTRSPRCG
jgi:glutamate-1-semialdehyde aminotransferase